MKKRLTKLKRRVHYILAAIGVVLLAVGAYCLFLLFNQGINDLLSLIGITNFYLQMGLVILIVLIGLVLSGFNFYKAFGKLARGS
jgi:hypothetical protein